MLPDSSDADGLNLQRALQHEALYKVLAHAGQWLWPLEVIAMETSTGGNLQGSMESMDMGSYSNPSMGDNRIPVA